MESTIKDETHLLTSTQAPDPSARFPRWGLWAVLAALLAVRVYCAQVYRVDSDEPQHLHVVWGVSQGLVQYRDLFDNHSPLFALLNAPLLRALGERADIVPLMRLGMIPLFFGCIGCVYLAGSSLFSRSYGLWAALLTAFHPRFFATSLEFRPDNLWVLCWLALLAVLVRVRRPGLRFFVAGMLLGTAFSVSMKTAVMALDLAAAGAFAWVLSGRPGMEWPRFAKWAFLFAGGAALVPGGLLLWFASRGALDDLVYCLIRHNLIAASERPYSLDLRALAALAVFAGVACWSRRLLAARTPLAARRGFVMLAGGLYPVLLFVVWPLVTREDFLALIPMAALVFVGAFAAFVKPGRRFGGPNALLAGALALLVILDFWTVRPWQDRSRFHANFVAGILKLTGPGDEVMDTKGEMIYRNRPVYLAFEEMTRWMFKRNRLDDDIPERMIARRVRVASNNYGRFPARTKHFLKKNFIAVAFRTLVAGKIINPAGPVTFFDIAIPARYCVISKTPGEVLLDGRACAESILLEPGRHFITAPVNSGPVAVVWARAVERGFDPFYSPSPEERREAKRARLDNIL